MDPADITPYVDLKAVIKSNADVVEDTCKLQISDCESVTEVTDSEKECEEQTSTVTDDVDERNSVHIIFVRNEQDSISNSEHSKEKLGPVYCSVDNGSETKGLMIRSPKSKVRVSVVPSALSSPNEACDTDGEISSNVSHENSQEEVEDDFDTSEEVVFQIAQMSPLPCELRKRREKRNCKVCKACGMSVERKDFLSHIKEHRRRKQKFAQNRPPNVIEKSVKTLEHDNRSFLSTENILSKSDSSRTVSNIKCETNLTHSSLSNSVSDRPFKCSVCTETFRTQSSLTIHFKSHSGECSKSCPVS